MKRLLLALILCGLTSCTLFPAQTFTEKYATGISGATAALSTTDSLLQAGKITPADAKNIEKQVDNIHEALDLAKQVYATDQTSGGNKLASALTALQGISTYLAQKGK